MANKRQNKKSAKTLIVLGSGGHTTEMIEIINQLDRKKYTPRYYMLAKSDKTSQMKITEFENDIKNTTFVYITRSRNVMQSYFSSIFTTIFAIFNCVLFLWKTRPDLVLCNGPGTCVPVCLVAFFYKFIGVMPNTKIVFIESFCRVKTISFSGKILKYIVDLFVVQWPGLNKLNTEFKYYGKLM